MPEEFIILEDDIGNSYFRRRKFQGDINSPAMKALRKYASELTEEGKPKISKEELERMRETMSAEEIQVEIGGIERDPWVDPTAAGAAAFGGAGLMSLKAGAKIFPALGRALTAGMVGGAAEYPLGMAAEKVAAGKYPGLTLPFAITTGLLSGVTVENAIEKVVIKSLTKKGVKPAAEAVSENIKKVKADLGAGKVEDDLTASVVKDLNALVEKPGVSKFEQLLETLPEEQKTGKKIEEVEKIFNAITEKYPNVEEKMSRVLHAKLVGKHGETMGGVITLSTVDVPTLGHEVGELLQPVAQFGRGRTIVGKAARERDELSDAVAYVLTEEAGLKLPRKKPDSELLDRARDLLSGREQLEVLSPGELKAVEKLGDTREPLVKVISEAEPKVKEYFKKTPSELSAEERIFPVLGRVEAININLKRIESPEDIKKVITKTADIYEAGIEEARRGEITNVQTSRLANLLGMNPEDLLKRQKGEAFNAQEALAARRILVSSASALMEGSKKILSGEATDLDKFEFQKMFATHYAIQAQVSGMTAEAGRALQSFKIMAKSSEGKVKEIKQFMETLGTTRGVTSDQLASMLSKMDTVEGITRFVKEAQKATIFDMVVEAWINGLLSGPQTHAVNTLSNSLVALWQIPERFLARGFGKVLPGKAEITQGEVLEQCFGLVEGFKDGLKLFGKALWTGESDTFSKIEVRHRRAISAKNLNIEEAGIAGRAVDLLGEGVRIPGRFLGAEDEFFKAVGYRMELRARAFRQAKMEGLEGEEAAKRMQQIINEPPDDIHLDAIEAARYQTFTQELGKFGRGLQNIIGNHPALKFIVPFIRTPLNIVKFAGERTPAGFFYKQVQRDIVAGGARRDLALARIALGSTIMAVTVSLAAEGHITGGGPSDSKLRQIKRNTGWQPYSIMIGDKYYAYSRLEPLGILLGLSADCAEISGELSRGEMDSYAAAAVATVSKNVLSKTWLRGISEVLNVVTDPERYGERWLQNYAKTMVPTGIAQIERVMDPMMQETNTIRDALKSRIPGYSKTLPPRRNLWGEPIVLEGGLGPDIISPVYVSTRKYSPIDEELLRLRMPLSMPRETQSIHGESIELNLEEYDRFLVLMNDITMPDTGKNLKDTLNHLVTKSSIYRDMTEDQKEMRIRGYLVMAKALAREKLWEETPYIKWLVNTLQLEKMQVQ
jgi:hypothetical protein